APQTAYYWPNFISEEEEALLLEKIYASPKPRWTQLNHRRLQNWGGHPHQNGMIPEDIPHASILSLGWLFQYCNRVKETGIFENRDPNHVLINEYLPGQGIMAHLDGPTFWPVVATLNLGSHTMLDFYHPIPDASTTQVEDRYLGSLLLESRSLSVLCHDFYSKYLHGIKETISDPVKGENVIWNLSRTQALEGECLQRRTRISLTIRHVPKVLKTRLRL
ncbi:unnamed protein product, partial [Darwinula stevensoni]